MLRRRSTHKPTNGQKFTIAPAPKQAEPTHTSDLTFPSSLRLGMLRTEELIAARNDREARLRQAARLAGPLRKVATLEENQLHVELISYELEIKRRALSDCLRQRAQSSP